METEEAEPLPSTHQQRFAPVAIELPVSDLRASPRAYSLGYVRPFGLRYVVVHEPNRWRTSPWQPDPELAFEYFHFGELGGSWAMRAHVELHTPQPASRAQRRSLRRALAAHRKQLETCHLDNRETDRRELQLEYDGGQLRVELRVRGYTEDPNIEACVAHALAGFEWPASLPASLTLELNWR